MIYLSLDTVLGGNRLLQIFSEESLHGYVLRVISVHGLASKPDDISGIITASGVMRTDFSLNKQQRNLFSAFPVTTLIKMIENHMFAVGCPTFSNPKSLAAKCGRIFFDRQTGVSEVYKLNSHPSSKVIYRLRYCPECLREQIKENGSGWFKLNWLICNTCDIHNLELISIKNQVCSCKLNICEKLNSALSGVCAQCKSSSWPEPKKDYKRFGSPLVIQKTYGDYKKIPVSACVLRGFVEWLKGFKEKLYGKDKLYERFAPLIVDNLGKLTYVNARYLADWHVRPISAGYLFYMLNLFEAFANDNLCEFLDNQTEIIKVNCSDCVPAQIVVDYRVATDRDCATCSEKSGECPLKI